MNRPAIMGILNVTPDSFSGDGVLAEAALKQALQLAEAGADILDIGAESTRPGATPLSAEEEWARLEPVLTAIAAQPWRDRMRISIDTRHAATAAHALNFGASIINDVGGLADDAMCETLEEHECDIVVMHALSIPADASVTLPADADAIAEILAWKARVMARAAAHGIGTHRLIYDPGIGFGKTAQQSLALIERAAELKKSGGRWLIGHSRKSFMKLFETSLPDQKSVSSNASLRIHPRDALTLQFSHQLADAGIDYLRVHDVVGHTKLFERLCT